MICFLHLKYSFQAFACYIEIIILMFFPQITEYKLKSTIYWTDIVLGLVCDMEMGLIIHIHVDKIEQMFYIKNRTSVLDKENYDGKRRKIKSIRRGIITD